MIFEKPAKELVREMSEGTLTAEEVFVAHLERVKTLDPEVKAVVFQDQELGLAQARVCDRRVQDGRPLGPLHGLPVTIKDSWDVEGMPTTSGLPWLRKNLAPTDALCVARLRKAGAIPWAKTNLPFAAYDWQCKNPIFGTTNNPWNLNHTVGGSSGGSAAAVAAGFTSLELGSDIAGSTRFPAHCCGVYSLRATENLLSLKGHGRVPGSVKAVRNLLAPGPMARNLDDLGLMLEVLGDFAGPSPSVALENLRVAWHTAHGDWIPTESIRRALEETAGGLSSRVATVEQAHPCLDLEDALAVWGGIQGFEMGVAYPRLLQNALVRWMHSFTLKSAFGESPWTLGLRQGLRGSRRDYFAHLERRDSLVEEMDRFFESYDLWLTPVALVQAFEHQPYGRPFNIDGRSVPYSTACGYHNSATAVTGHPVLTLPVGFSDGLPVALQLHAARGRDRWLIEVARALGELWSSKTLAPL